MSTHQNIKISKHHTFQNIVEHIKNLAYFPFSDRCEHILEKSQSNLVNFDIWKEAFSAVGMPCPTRVHWSYK